MPSDEVRMIFQTEDIQLQRLPWHLWDLIERYPKAEIALSAPAYERKAQPSPRKAKVRILAILGNSAGINTQADRALLEQLPGAEISFLVEPQRQELTDQLWEQQGWDILFFAGHSSSQVNCETGRFYINQTDSLTIGELKYALRQAVERGLKLAIFNSCDGLGLARDLVELHIPQLIVMREPIPDRIAQEFLKHFLETFAHGKSFYLAVREARERLQGLENHFPCATWLPIICQNLAEVPPTWQGLGGRIDPSPHLVDKPLLDLVTPLTQPECRKRQDWGEAVDVSVFYGRIEELATLEQWIVKDHCRLVALLGMGGIGKTALSVKLAEQIQDQFEYVIWRSLRNAPPIKELLTELILFLSDQQETNLPETVDAQVSRLINYLRSSRCLLVLDNVEAILSSGKCAGHYRAGYEGYGELIRRVGEERHQSCLVLTGREKPEEITWLEGETLPVRLLQLTGLKEPEAQKILNVKGLLGAEDESRRLIACYRGNPLALKIVSTSIRELFEGNISEFLAQGTAVFNGIRHLLDQQFNRLSDLEKQIMYWLAINREPVSVAELQADIVPPVSKPKLLEALESLVGRSLVERSAVGFTQQPVVMEYVADKFIEQASTEIKTGEIALFNSYALLKATAKDYVRNTQARLLLKPVTDTLLTVFRGKINFECQLTSILSKLREGSPRAAGYAGGNVLNLLCELETDLSNQNFSHLTVWQAYLKGVNLHLANFSHSDLAKSVFAETLGSVFTAVFSPDGKLLATGDAEGVIRLWQVADGKPLLVCKGHMSWVWSVAFSPDGQTLASCSNDQTLKLWEVSTGRCYQTLQGHTDLVFSVAFSPDGQTLASCSSDQTIRLWDVRTSQCYQTLQGHTSYVRSVAFSPDGYTLASGSWDKRVRLWDVTTGQCLKTLHGHTNSVDSVSFSPNGQTLASGSEDQMVKLWDVSTGQCYRTLQGHTHQVLSISFSPNGQTLASGSEDQTVKLWDVTTGQCLKTLQGHTSRVWSVVFSPNGLILASSGEDQSVRLWEVTTWQCLRTLQGYTSSVFSIDFSPNGETLASGAEDQSIRLWDIRTGQCCKTWQGHSSRVLSITFSPNGQTLASGSSDYTVKLWNTGTGQYLKTLQGHTSAGWQE